jgi:hypothetical protein
MDYQDDVKYPETCEKAVARDIVINTIQCGNDGECKKHWSEIAKQSEGTYVGIAQEGGVVAIATPFDKRLGEINTDLARNTLVYGTKEVQRDGTTKNAAAASLPAGPAADRAGLAAKAGRSASYDLLDALKKKQVKLADLKDAELPPELRKLDAKGRQEYLDRLEKTRADLQKEALELDKKRNEYLVKEQATSKDKSAFDVQVLGVLRKQAKKHHIDY